MSLQTSKASELRDALLHFTTSYLEEQPGDVINYAVAYFKQLQEKRKILKLEEKQHEHEESDEDENSISDFEVSHKFNRRKSVFAESYDPKNDPDQYQGGHKIHKKTDEQKSLLVNALKDILIFKTIDKDQTKKLIDTMYDKNVSEDQTLAAQGADCDHFYVIESGTFNVYVDDDIVHTFQDSGHFGEVALLYNEPGSATVKAATNGKVWVLKRATFRRVVLRAAFNKRNLYENLINNTPMLGSLQNHERMTLADALVSMSFRRGERIIKQGDVGDGMYFIEEGAVVVRLEQENEPDIELVILHKGAYFGELALITHLPRSASCYAHTDCTCAFLEINCFNRLVGNFLEVIKRNMPLYEENIQKILLRNNKC